MGSHFKKLNLNEAEENFTLISEMLRKSLKGGCHDCDVPVSMEMSSFSKSEYDLMATNGAWSGGYMCGMGFVPSVDNASGGKEEQEPRLPPNYCSKHKLDYFSICPFCFEEGMFDYNQDSGNYGSPNYGDPYDPYAGNYGGYPNIPGVTRLPDYDITFPDYFQTQKNGDSLEACKTILSRCGVYNAGDPYNVYQLQKEVNGVLTDYGSNPNITFQNGIDCINRHLDACRRIVVGINHTLNYGQNEGTTDQFVLITGRGYDSSKNMYYFIYMDPARTNAADGCNTSENRLYCYAPGSELYDDSTYMGKRFDVTQIRPNDGKKSEELINSTII